MGRKVTTGFKATARKDVTLTWKCSHCAADNRATQVLEGTSQTGLFFGNPTNPNYRQEAQECLVELMKDLCKPKPSDRYLDAAFDCKCRSCGKREPWAKLRYDYLKTVWKFIGWTVMFAFAFFAGQVTPIPFLLYLVAMLWASVHKPIHKKVMLKQIDRLNPESLPRITVDLNGIPIELAPEGSNNPEPPREDPPDPDISTRPVVEIPAPKLRSVVLLVMTGARAGATFRFQEGQAVTIGRNPSQCNLVLGEYTAISRCHCRLELREANLIVTDMGSTGGTWLNGRLLCNGHPVPVPDGSILWLASKDCTIQVKFD